MDKEIKVLAKVQIYPKNEKTWAVNGFVVLVEFPKVKKSNIEEMANEFAEKSKEAFKVFAYGGDIEKEELGAEFIELFCAD